MWIHNPRRLRVAAVSLLTCPRCMQDVCVIAVTHSLTVHMPLTVPSTHALAVMLGHHKCFSFFVIIVIVAAHSFK